ncbi:KN motif and ankyrin repeat domain-containing protein 4-like isoform X2 [Thalassophryne amazonica]|uniref:KN motif and ankyrin repeat domain-containing protein 4-like isoform X2 n=1 Tax=Thalassophryne amazonica TaxID=390379 RepID=UPI0014720C90|nr:KN motif and ankyrin repeat domain-containing protein 4-like isoform X2 [Thalassophryne amazonica]
MKNERVPQELHRAVPYRNVSNTPELLLAIICRDRRCCWTGAASHRHHVSVVSEDRQSEPERPTEDKHVFTSTTTTSEKLRNTWYKVPMVQPDNMTTSCSHSKLTERQNGSVLPNKTTTNGIQWRPPYSVETPYGFRLDLDFLKYVDDIEKGNTIKRIPIQRRSKGPRSSTLPRNINPSNIGSHPSPWGSTGALGIRSRLLDAHPRHGYTSWAYDHRYVSPKGQKSLAEMEARIKEFDEQPLGEHIRPHLLRASSLPLTVLLNQGSESVDDLGSLRNSRDHLIGRNISCEDIFHSPDSPHTLDGSGLVRRLTEALERVSELEMEVRVIPELKTQISTLQEERERLLLGLNPSDQSSVRTTTNSHSFPNMCTLSVKRPQYESYVPSPRNHYSDLSHEWRNSTDLDELLTVTSLQAKVAALEQKLHETSLELQKMLGILKEQQEESQRKEENIEQLLRNSGTWVHADRVVAQDERNERADTSTEIYNHKVSSSRAPDGVISLQNASANAQRNRHVADSTLSSTLKVPPVLVEPREDFTEDKDNVVILYHIKRIKRLLGQQWECLCTVMGSTHPDPKVTSLQQEMMGLVDMLSSYYSQDGQTQTQYQASKSVRTSDECTGTLKNSYPAVQDGISLDGQCWLDQSVSPGDVDAEPEKDDHITPERQTTSDETQSGGTDGGPASVDTPETQQPPGKQMEGKSETNTASREIVSGEFLAACQFLKDHMDNTDHPNDDARKAFIVVFQSWFTAAAEETSEAHVVSAYLAEVKKATPSLLAFLVNLADDNGNSVLHYSVSHCNYSIVSLLLDTGVSDVNLQNKSGYTAVMLASLTAPEDPSGMEVVRRLMLLGNINICSSQTGQTALHLAVRHGRVAMVCLLLSCGADANIQDAQGTTALMFASERGHTHIARLLLERSDLDLTDKHGRSALCIAVHGSHTDTAALLQAHAKAEVL